MSNTGGWIRYRSPDGTQDETCEFPSARARELRDAGWHWMGHFEGFSEDDRARAREVYGDHGQVVLDRHEADSKARLG